MSHEQNAGQYVNNVNIGNKFFERVKQSKCLGTTQINQNFMYEEIRSCMNLWGILAIIQYGFFRFPICYPKI